MNTNSLNKAVLIKSKLHSDFKALSRTVYAIIILIIIGSLGFHHLEGWGYIDSFYMTLTTLSTVGFGELYPLSQTGRLFTSALIIAGVGTAAYSFAAVTRAIIEGQFLKVRIINTMNKKIAALENHSIVCGYGNLGKSVVRELISQNESFVVIDLNTEIDPKLGVLQIQGEAFNDQTLIDSGILKAKNLLALLPDDKSNVYTVLCARALNPGIKIIARAEDDIIKQYLLRAGANEVIAPYRVSGFRIAQRIARPNISEFIELVGGENDVNLALEEVVINETSALANKTLSSSQLSKSGVIVAAFVSPDGKMIFNPGAESIISSGDTLIVLGPKSSLNALDKLL